MQEPRLRRAWQAAFVALAVAVTSPAFAASIDEVPSGTILSKDNWEIGKGLMPDEILEFYKRGEYANPILKLEALHLSAVDPNLKAASEKNRGKFDINEDGTVVDKATGQRPAIITGQPFPDIDGKDPKAGSKAIWNWFYTLYWEGSFHTQSPVNWISRDGLLRRIETDVHFKYYDGAPPFFQSRIGENPLNVLARTIGTVKEPADVNGIVNLNWRFREGNKQDQAWVYVPALRRVRPINPANRSDGLLGSDISLDDGPYFDGKPEDFTFKLVGEGTVLAHYDKPALENGSPVKKIKPGTPISDQIDSSEVGWRLETPEYQLIPSECSGTLKAAGKCQAWTKGEGLVAWAPLQWALVPRPVWIVEAIPKNPYYLYGKQVMYLDKETGRGYWKNKYDWKGNALVNYALPQFQITKVDGEPGYLRTGGGGNAGYAVNYKLDRATVTGMPVHPTEYYIDIPDQIFETDRIVRSGK
jgi:hypothetical protein